MTLSAFRQPYPGHDPQEIATPYPLAVSIFSYFRTAVLMRWVLSTVSFDPVDNMWISFLLTCPSRNGAQGEQQRYLHTVVPWQ